MDAVGTVSVHPVSNRRAWWLFILSCFLVKLVIFAVDPWPVFFMGDSASYIWTALSGWIPPDRSFVYGFAVRLFAVSFSSLTPLIIAQIFANIISIILLVYALVNFIRIPNRIAFILGALCLVEPMQLLYERYVMTETFSLMVFAIYMVLAFHYLEKRKLVYLFLMQLAGVLLISLRISFLPIIFANTILAPLLMSLYCAETAPKTRIHALPGKLQRLGFSRPVLRLGVLHVTASLIFMLALHSGYRHLNGFLSKRPPAYLYENGFFLLTAVAPIIKRSDFRSPRLADAVYAHTQKLHDRHARIFQMWLPGGIAALLMKAAPNGLEANRIAWRVAIHAIERDPMALALLSGKTFYDFWNVAGLTGSIHADLYSTQLPNPFLGELKTNFDLSAEGLPSLRTFTKGYFAMCWPWYLFLLCLPLVALAAVFVCDPQIRPHAILIFVAGSGIVAVSTTFVVAPIVRYLHPLPWLFFLLAGAILAPVFKRKEVQEKRREQLLRARPK